MNTLRGVFPEPPPIPRRNFIRENMIYIKRMQGFVEDTSDQNSIKRRNKQISLDSESNERTMKLIRNTKKQLQTLNKLSNPEKTIKAIPKSSDKNIPKNKNVPKQKSVHNECPMYKTAVEAFKDNLEKRRFREIGIQTEQFNNVKQLYETGTIKYPSSQVLQILTQNKSPELSKRSPRQIGDGDKMRSRTTDHSPEVNHSGDERKHDFVKENAQVVKNNNKSSPTKDPTMPPPTYQKGVIPKYLRERKEELIKQTKNAEGDERCPEGHVILPENERKETLRMLRQSYAELVTELNQLPVRSDTLKIRNRKIEIENQLKKLDEGIKVFTRPKVYVKIGA